ncbi:MAG TPA: peptide ABC transporter permease [Colwellia sp.]|nr:peptide ABC transporter permease [Colwellia sp.]
MSNHIQLNNQTHKTLKASIKFSNEFGDNVSSALTFPTEFMNIQKEYPILFSKNPDTGEFQSVVLFGLKKDENLYLQKGEWNANYIPAVMAKGPFLIGKEDQEIEGETVNSAIIVVNMDSPRIDNINGEAVFLDNGISSPYLDKITHALSIIDQGTAMSKAMFDAFNEYDLIEPITLDIELNNGEKWNISGNYTIHAEKLAQLDGLALDKLNKAGFLSLAFSVTASLSNVKKLVDIKNASV